MKADNWKDFTRELVVAYCNERGSRTFTLQELQAEKEVEIISLASITNILLIKYVSNYSC